MIADHTADEPVVLLESYAGKADDASYRFTGYRGDIVAKSVDEVATALAAVESSVSDGLHAAGYVSYEAAAGVDPVLATGQPGDLPLVWFGLFDQRIRVPAGKCGRLGRYALSSWRPSIPRREYDLGIRRIREYIAAGDTYQVNYTYRLRADFDGDAHAFYRHLCLSQRASYCAYIDLGRFKVLSASPELFFSLKNGTATARPMKGTISRGRWLEEDEAQADVLHASEKNRAENLMIVDLVRSDLGRVSEVGSVHVDRLWEVERYDTVHHMTSTIRSRISPATRLQDVLRALFPSGSVTGAPKVRTMQIIAELEDSPRGVYAGCIGYVSPGPEVQFNVAIRTVCIDTARGRAEFGVGGGVTYDSSADGEYEECDLKAGVLLTRPEFALVEEIRHTPENRYFLLDRHLARLAASAGYFGFDYDAEAVRSALDAARPDGAGFVRLLLHRDGRVDVGAQALPIGPRNLSAFVLRGAVDTRDPFLYHHTSLRHSHAPSDSDVRILRNERGEMTECEDGNLVVELDGVRWTPPVECGLLPGILRAELLGRGELRERVLRAEDLDRATAVYRIDEMLGWARLEQESTAGEVGLSPEQMAGAGSASDRASS